MQTKLKEIKNNEEGAALIFVMMILLVFVAIGGAVGTVTVGSHRLSDNNKNYNSAYYIAEAGANMTYEEISDLVQGIYSKPNITDGKKMFEEIDFNLINSSDENHSVYNFEEQYGQIPTATVEIIDKEIVKENQTQKYIIKSVGDVDGKTRTVDKEIVVTWKEKKQENPNDNSLGLPKDAAVIFKGKVDFGNNLIDYTGNIIHDGTGEIDKNKDDNEVITDKEIDWSAIEEYLKHIPTNLVSLNEYEHKTINNGKIVIDTKGKTVNIELHTLDNSIEVIQIINGGKVNLYIANISNGSHKYNLNVGENTDPKNLNVFYSGTNFELGQSAQLNGMLYAPNATVTLKNSARINGSVIANNVEFGNGSGVSYPPGFTFGYPVTESTDTNSTEEPQEVELITSSPALEN